ncbi:uncharacterized protein IUM83_08940 [Phytophthora cinnamomi]|uniref:uncharacterized protein n=1 Tax=Phytophthora cinnamomi TaxID=4785 RepID=UPI00355A1937|nr:hypothetical protein IUM83_08940 [Phytophthora cinnamomi]
MAKVSQNAVSDWYAGCRVLCSKELLNGEFKIGGGGHIAEIDETSLKRKSKYGRGKFCKEVWLFGGVDRTTGQWFGCIVYNKRTKATLLPIIKKFIKPRTRIHSDMFASYVAERGARVHTLANNHMLAGMHYEHSWVNHSLNFVDPVTGTHTNTIDGLWEMHIKRHIKAMRGMKKDYLDGYLDEYMWRSCFFFRHVPRQMNAMAHNYNLQRLHLFDFGAVMEATTDEVKAATWAMEVGLLEKAMLCPQCAKPMCATGGAAGKPVTPTENRSNAASS